jgi:hypothetical protein
VRGLSPEGRPFDQPSKEDESDPHRLVRAPWLDLPLPVQSQLLAQKEILGSQSTMGLHSERDDTKKINEESERGPNQDGRMIINLAQ